MLVYCSYPGFRSHSLSMAVRPLLYRLGQNQRATHAYAYFRTYIRDMLVVAPRQPTNYLPTCAGRRIACTATHSNTREASRRRSKRNTATDLPLPWSRAKRLLPCQARLRKRRLDCVSSKEHFFSSPFSFFFTASSAGRGGGGTPILLCETPRILAAEQQQTLIVGVGEENEPRMLKYRTNLCFQFDTYTRARATLFVTVQSLRHVV